MFSKIWSSVVVVAFALNVHAHAGVSPALGVSGTFARSDVQRPSAAKPCGTEDVATALATSTPVVAAADGTFTATATNFNAGTDGSRQFAATVDSTATGKNFVAAVVTTNGDASPTNVGSQPIVASIPAGTTCTGGAGKNLCLFSFKSLGGFGNCVAVQQGASTAAAATTATGANSTDAAATGTNSTAATAEGAAAAGGAAAAVVAAGKKAHAGKGKGAVGSHAAHAGKAAAAAKAKAAAAKAKAPAAAAGGQAAAAPGGGVPAKLAAGGKGSRAARALLAVMEKL